MKKRYCQIFSESILDRNVKKCENNITFVVQNLQKFKILSIMITLNILNYIYLLLIFLNIRGKKGNKCDVEVL